MQKQGISAKINPSVIKESKKVATKRGISFSRFVEVALIHELNGRDYDNGLLAELEDIQEYVSRKMEDLSVIKDSDVSFEVYDAEYYVERLRQLQETRGYVSVDVVETFAKKSCLSLKEFLSLLNDDDCDFVIR